MSAYEIIKDCISVAQKADNIPLIQSLIEAQKQILDLQDENMSLRKQINDIKEIESVKTKIMRHKEPIITILGEEEIYYCSQCWDSEKKLIQVDTCDGRYTCPHCKYEGYYNREEAYNAQQKAFNSMLGKSTSPFNYL